MGLTSVSLYSGKVTAQFGPQNKHIIALLKVLSNPVRCLPNFPQLSLKLSRCFPLLTTP